MENNLNELNNTLFETLKGVQAGTLKREDAKVINEIAGTIINNAKVQIDAFKATKGIFQPQEGIGVDNPGKLIALPDDVYAQKHEFSIFKGYKNVSECIAALGKKGFETEFKLWNND